MPWLGLCQDISFMTENPEQKVMLGSGQAWYSLTSLCTSPSRLPFFSVLFCSQIGPAPRAAKSLHILSCGYRLFLLESNHTMTPHHILDAKTSLHSELPFHALAQAPGYPPSLPATISRAQEQTLSLGTAIPSSFCMQQSVQSLGATQTGASHNPPATTPVQCYSKIIFSGQWRT